MDVKNSEQAEMDVGEAIGQQWPEWLMMMMMHFTVGQTNANYVT